MEVGEGPGRFREFEKEVVQMELMTKEIEKKLAKYPLHSQDGLGGEARVVVKYFGGSAATWLITEGEKQKDGDWLFFGFITLGIRDPSDSSKLLWEWGYVRLSELEDVRFPPFGLPAERDLYLDPHAKVCDEVFMCSQYGSD